MEFAREENGRLVWRRGHETLWLEGWGADGLRVRCTKLARMEDADGALLPGGEHTADVRCGAHEATITNGRVRASLTDGGRLRFWNAQGKLLLEEYVRTREDVTQFCSALNLRGREFVPGAGDTFRLTVRFESDPQEKLFGMGQYQQRFLDLKGCQLELAQRNSQASVPFLLSSLGYGFLWNNPAVGRAVFGKNITEWTALRTSRMDYWITAGDTPADIEERYAAVTGTVPMMPAYAMGFWQCKLRYQTQEELLGVAREYHRRGIPLAVIVADFFHWTCQGDWKFDPAYWPDPAAMVRELRAMGTELMVSIWPTVDKQSENYREMREKGYLVQTDRGVPTTMEEIGSTVFFDATNPAARAYVWGKAKQNYYDNGIRIFWLDEAEPEYTAYDYDLYRYDAGTDLQVGNAYPVQYARAFYEGMQAAGQKDILNLIRCAWAGSQRYGALVWSGDIYSSFEVLRCQLCAGLNMGIAGIPWWTTDIGGFHGGDPRDEAFRELVVRWFEFGTFCPVMRIHGDREPHSAPLGTSGGGLFASGAANEVWSYGEEACAILVHYIGLREKLRPYIARVMRAAHEKGSPVMRPLFYGFPQDARCWTETESYLFGPSLLVAPVLYAGMRSRRVYLPAGCRWRALAGGDVHEGGTELLCDAPLDAIPVFVREGDDVFAAE